MSGPRFDPRRGTLVLGTDDLRALAAGRHDDVPLLARLGAVRDGRPHPGLHDTIDALRHPVAGTLQLSHSGRALDGWRGRRTTALLTPPDPDGLRTLVRGDAGRLVPALARVAALTARPRAPPAPRRRAPARSTCRRWA